MEEWLKVTILLSTFGFLREIRPSEPYVTEFLTDTRWRNITEDVVNKEVYPVGTYSYLSLLVIVFLVTDLLRYKPIIVLSGFCGIAVYLILLFTKSLAWLQVSQFFYGLYIATEVAYYTYMYTKVERDKYAAVSSWTRSAALCGRLCSGITAQALTSFSVMNYRDLNYLTLTGQVTATFWALLLPPVRNSLYFHSNQEGETLTGESKNSIKRTDMKSVLTRLYSETKVSYSNQILLGWSLFYAATACCFIQVQNYIQLLWKEIDPEVQSAYNGLVEALLTGGGAIGAAVVSRWIAPSFLIGPVSLVQGALLLLPLIYANLLVAYVVYVLIGILHHYLLTLASAKIARELQDESFFGLIFGINTLVSTAMQSLLTLIVISDLGFALTIRGQFFVYCICYLSIFVFWILSIFIKKFLKIMLKKREGISNDIFVG